MPTIKIAHFTSQQPSAVVNQIRPYQPHKFRGPMAPPRSFQIPNRIKQLTLHDQCQPLVSTHRPFRKAAICPEIFNSDQGSHFTSLVLTSVLKYAGVRISMDGMGRWMDNVFIEHLWQTLKYECIYLQAFDTGSETRAGIGWWIEYFNTDWPHSALDGRTPDEAYNGLAVTRGPGHAPDPAEEALAARQ